MAWDLAPDGERVAVLTPVEIPGTSKRDHEVLFLFNFLDICSSAYRLANELWAEG